MHVHINTITQQHFADSGKVINEYCITDFPLPGINPYIILMDSRALQVTKWKIFSLYISHFSLYISRFCLYISHFLYIYPSFVYIYRISFIYIQVVLIYIAFPLYISRFCLYILHFLYISRFAFIYIAFPLYIEVGTNGLPYCHYETLLIIK